MGDTPKAAGEEREGMHQCPREVHRRGSSCRALCAGVRSKSVASALASPRAPSPPVMKGRREGRKGKRKKDGEDDHNSRHKNEGVVIALINRK